MTQESFKRGNSPIVKIQENDIWKKAHKKDYSMVD